MKQTSFEKNYDIHKNNCNGEIYFYGGFIVQGRYLHIYRCTKCNIKLING